MATKTEQNAKEIQMPCPACDEPIGKNESLAVHIRNDCEGIA